MNALIKELAIKANLSIRGHYDELGSTPSELEKFAELIVKECMTICEDVAERNDPAIACYYEIKRTFRS